MTSISDDARHERDEVAAKTLGIDPAVLGAMRTAAAAQNDKWRRRAEAIAEQSAEGLANELAGFIGVRLDQMASPDDGRPWKERRAEAKTRKPYLQRGYRVALRAIQLTRRLAESDPSSEHWALLTREIDALYLAAVFHGKAGEPSARLMVVDAIDTVASELRVILAMQALAAQRRGRPLSSQQKRALAKETPEKQQAEDRLAALSPAGVEQLASGEPADYLRELFLASFERSCPPGAGADELRAAARRVSAAAVKRAVAAWSTRGQGSTKWASVVRLLAEAGFQPVEQEAVRIAWHRWRSDRRARTRALASSNP
jgi:hypothetical protein